MGKNADTYKSYAELKKSEREGNDYRIRENKTNSPVVILAPHGGKIELHTSTIAESIAGDKYNLYLFEGIKRNKNCTLHITSSKFDEPRGVRLVESCDLAVAVHGLGREKEYVEVGGKNDDVAKLIIEELMAVDFDARKPAEKRLAGRNVSNICNRAKAYGVQLELCLSLRRNLTDQSSKELLGKFSTAIGRGVDEYMLNRAAQ